ncbi:hypothetical protein AVEN_17571-1 [Araneus ventricosus]|uniref:Uncharacterized protein n=1 Tax=Araneus ventricosus TaxID=182803 RepID=A0A4Y2IXX2_ARAVE|nr:hypothetical protein AVEN_17571-1 [Araneus ventricosus]
MSRFFVIHNKGYRQDDRLCLAPLVAMKPVLRHLSLRIVYTSDCEKELEKLKRVKMNSSSDFTISSDWDVIDDEMPKLDLDRKKSEEATSEDLKENMQKGSCVDDIVPEKEVNGTQEDSCVPDITEPEINNHHENSSSSEFDVLDESVEDNQSNLSFSHMEYSISSSLGESSHPSLVPEVEEVEADPEPQTSREYALNVHPYLVAITLSLAFIAILVGE